MVLNAEKQAFYRLWRSHYRLAQSAPHHPSAARANPRRVPTNHHRLRDRPAAHSGLGAAGHCPGLASQRGRVDRRPAQNPQTRAHRQNPAAARTSPATAPRQPKTPQRGARFVDGAGQSISHIKPTG